MTSTPTPNVRLTITVTPEVHQVFVRFSKAAGMSLGKAMGEWLGDTVEAAEFTATKMEQARSAPKLVMREMHAYALGLADETGALMQELTEKGRVSRESVRAKPRTSAQSAPIPPPSNTGGKGTKNHSGLSIPSKAETLKTSKKQFSGERPQRVAK